MRPLPIGVTTRDSHGPHRSRNLHRAVRGYSSGGFAVSKTMINYDYSAEGFDAILFRVRAVNESLRRELHDILTDAVAIAEAEWKALIPYRSGALYRSIRSSEVEYRPGGLGGGGSYQIELEVGGTENSDHLQAVVEGTGIYGSTGGRIYPAQGNVMVFTTDIGEKVFTEWTRGQEGRDEWILAGQRAANAYIGERIRTLDLFE